MIPVQSEALTPRQQAFERALAHAEFSHVERSILCGVETLTVYRFDPASSAGKGWLAAYPADSYAYVACLLAGVWEREGRRA